jgi:hypothetical protein
MGNKVGKLRSHISSNMAYCEIPHKKGWTRAPSALHDPLCSILYPVDKASIIADCIENQLTVHDLHDCDHRRHVQAKASKTSNQTKPCV